MRELHTRFGRDNIGYLWVFAEPMLLAVAVAIIHAYRKSSDSSISMVAVALCGYLTFILFRAIVLRAEGTLESNRPLLYHRMVTLLDMLLARAVLELASTIFAFFLLMGGAIVLGFASLPARPLWLLTGLLMMTWLAFGLSMIVCVASHVSRAFPRLLHAGMYLSLPISGAFFLMRWVPSSFRSAVEWVPLVQIEELVRYGQFADLDDRFVHLPFLVALCMGLTFVGLLALRAIRPHIHLE
ncbi:ABC transporter permease [Phenylobacterium montanum]|uniref:ABC transporter permease n=2 Tax=Phenylobacterium montanum TaxID=2823693 RepID=A0A975IYP1_9CAUL|nr:ABC transporter permease [Caulobacter sp. S6]